MEAEQINAQLEGLMKEAIELRAAATIPKRTDAPYEILGRLEEARQALDRLEEIMRIVGRMKFLAERQFVAFEAAEKEAWATALSKIRMLPAFKGDFIGPREKYAEADLTVINMTRQRLKAGRQFSHVQEANEFVRTCYFGMNGVRDDIKDMLTTLSIHN